MQFNRRKFLVNSTATTVTFTLNNISFAVNHDNRPMVTPNENSIIYLFLSGGPTHIETFNPIPNSPVDRRSIVGHLTTKTPGVRIGGLWENLSNKPEKFTIVNSFAHGDANHESAVHWMMTGERTVPNSAQKWPSYGSVISGQYGTNVKDGLPTYVKLNKIEHDAAAWMGSKYMGYTASAEGVKDLVMKDPARFQHRLEFLKVVESSNRLGNLPAAKSWTDLREQAINVLFGKASEAFMVEKDPEFDLYKKDQLGKDILTAMRLVERGVKFVTINYGGWDMHQNMLEGLKSKVPPLDFYLSKYFESAEKRNINYRNMLVMTGDFGRTPKVNKDGGRDHWPNLVPLFFACDSYPMNRVIGTSDTNAERPDQNPFNPEDLRWTMLDHVGINKAADWYSIEGRPMMFVKDSNSKNILKGV